MSKRFRGSLCAYCAKDAAITGDHIFAREFFVQSERANLPQAPVCANCNNVKSKLEHYLTAVLPFGGRHQDVSVNLSSMVPRRLQKNLRLYAQLSAGHTGTSIPLDGAKVEQLFGLIVRGLIWYHWKVFVNHQTHAVRSITATQAIARLFDDWVFTRKARARVTGDVGNRTFLYEGVQALDDPALTFWRFSIYGGLMVVGDAPSEPPTSQFVAFTSSKQIDPQLCKLLAIAES